MNEWYGPWAYPTNVPLTRYILFLLCFHHCSIDSNAILWTSFPEELLQPYGIALAQSNNVLSYVIFEGRSALRSVPEDICQKIVSLEVSKEMKALLLLLAGYSDAAHDVILGVTLENMEEAEYAATHRGETSWALEHPFSDVDDLLHSIIHRLEGHNIGEGGHSGWSNAKYWCSGGPKACEMPLSCTHSTLYQRLCRLAQAYAPLSISRGVIVSQTSGIHHEIIANGGHRRTVHVPMGCWDPIAYLNLCQEADINQELQSELVFLHSKELEQLYGYLLADLSRTCRDR